MKYLLLTLFFLYAGSIYAQAQPVTIDLRDGRQISEQNTKIGEIKRDKENGAESTSPVTINKSVFFFNDTFLHTTDCSFINFLKGCVIYNSLFMEDVNFGNVTIAGGDFSNLRFKGEVNFDYAGFTESPNFQSDTFYSNTTFIYDTFAYDVNFFSSVFLQNIDFSHVTFQHEVSFSSCIFFKYLNLSDLKMVNTTKLLFTNTHLPHLIDFSYNSHLTNEINFSSAYFDSSRLYTDKVRQWHYINLFKSEIPKIQIDYLHFRLCFYNSQEVDAIHLNDTFSKVFENYYGRKRNDPNAPVPFDSLFHIKAFTDYIHQLFPSADDTEQVIKTFITASIQRGWFPKRLSDDEIYSIYEKELKNIETRGLKLSYQNLNIEYSKFKDKSAEKWRSNLNEWWWNFGYNKEYVFVHATIFLLFFTLITFFLLGFLNEEVYSFDHLSKYPINDLRLIKKKQPNGDTLSAEENTYLLDTAAATTQNRYISKYFPFSLLLKIKKEPTNEQSLTTTGKNMLSVILIVLLILSVRYFKQTEDHIRHFDFYRYAIIHYQGILLVIVIFATIRLIAKKFAQHTLFWFINSLYLRLWLSFIYTCTLFFPIFLKIENVKYKNKLMVFYIFLVYTTGLLCVGYITNFVIQK